MKGIGVDIRGDSLNTVCGLGNKGVDRVVSYIGMSNTGGNRK